jgi:class 3 adenylate cyclase
MSFFTHLEVRWEYAPLARFTRRLASFSRTILFDRRGIGVSDPLDTMSWQDWLDDMLAVLDDVGSQQTAIFASADAGPMAILFAATYPERVSSLVLWNTTAKTLAGDGYPYGLPPEFAEPMLQTIEDSWGREDGAFTRALGGPMADDPVWRQWWCKLLRSSLTPGRAAAFYRLLLQMDARPYLPLVRVPTLVMHPKDWPTIPIENGRFIAENIPGADFVEIPVDHGYVYTGKAAEPVGNEVERFLTGRKPTELAADRVLATVLFTDIVGSTDRAAAEGDRAWRALLDSHDEIARTHVEMYRGRLVKTTGDGILATFDGPARALRCASELSRALERYGIPTRCGLHAGEIEIRDHDVGGIAVHIAARVMSEAGPGEVLASSTVRDLVAGSMIEFADHGTRQLKGVPGEWRLFAAEV